MQRCIARLKDVGEFELTELDREEAEGVGKKMEKAASAIQSHACMCIYDTSASCR